MIRRRTTLSIHRVIGPPASTPVVPTAAEPVGAPCLVAGLIAASPTPGRFYAVAPRDTFSDISRRALDAYQRGLGSGGTARLTYMHCAAAGRRWNLRHYGSPRTSRAYSESLLVDGYGIAAGFEAWNPDAREALRGGTWPHRAIDDDGERIRGLGTHRGLIWLPIIEGWRQAAGIWIPVCDDCDPPALLLDALYSPG